MNPKFSCEESPYKQLLAACGKRATFVVRYVGKEDKAPVSTAVCSQHLAKGARFAFEHKHPDYGVSVLDLTHPADKN